MSQSHREIVAWVASAILPHEREARAWLAKSGTPAHEADDLVQEAYCRIAGLPQISHIANGRAYLFQTLRNLAIERIRKSRIVRIDAATEIELLNVIDGDPSPEQAAASRLELRRVSALIEGLPERCRQIFKLRRLHGLSQKEVARRLCVTENVVEMQTQRALKLILQGVAKDDSQSWAKRGAQDERRDKRRRE